MDNEQNNAIIDNCVDSVCFDNNNNALLIDKPIVSEDTNEIKERSLLNEARVEGFKTIEQAEAFLRRENHTLVKPMNEKAITSRVNVLREEIEEAQEKENAVVQRFDFKNAQKKLEIIPESEDLNSNIDSAKNFIDSECTDINSISSIKIYILDHITEHFKIPKKYGKLLVAHFEDKNKEAVQKYKEGLKKSGFKSKIDEDKPKTESIDFDEEGVSEESQIAAKEKALEILKTGDPIQKIKDTVGKSHVGDDDFEELLAIAVASQSCSNTAGIQPSMHGAAGTGKSHAAKMHLHLIRMRHKNETTMSAKSAYYNPLKPGCIVFSDDTEPDENLTETIKRCTTNYQESTKHSTVNNGKGEVFFIPGRIMWLLTSVDNNSSDQLSDRQVKCNTDEKPEHKEKACDKQLEEAEKGIWGLTEVDEDILICRYIYDEIKSHLFKVKIPFSKRIKFYAKDNLRNTQRFLDMIKGYTVMYHMQREIDEEGYLLADEKDFYFAKDLFKTQVESAVSKLTSKERDIMNCIDTYGPCTVNDIVNKVKDNYQNITNILKGRKGAVSGGLLSKVDGLTITEDSSAEEIEKDGVIKTVGRKATYYKLCAKEGGSFADKYNIKFADLI